MMVARKYPSCNEESLRFVRTMTDGHLFKLYYETVGKYEFEDIVYDKRKKKYQTIKRIGGKTFKKMPFSLRQLLKMDGHDRALALRANSKLRRLYMEKVERKA